MPACGIIQCAAKKDNVHKNLTLHLFPMNNLMRHKWLRIIGKNNIRPACRHRPYVCSLHFEQKYFNKSMQRTRLFPDAVPTLDLPKKTTLAQNVNGEQIKTVIHEAVKLADSSQKISNDASIPPLKVQFKDTSTHSDSNNTHSASLTPLVIVDIPPAAEDIKPISPVIEENPFFNSKKEMRLRNRCTFLEKQLRACQQKVRRRVAIIDKLEAEKKELTGQHLRTVELLKGGDKTDPKFDHILYKAVMKLS